MLPSQIVFSFTGLFIVHFSMKINPQTLETALILLYHCFASSYIIVGCTTVQTQIDLQLQQWNLKTRDCE